MKKIVLSALTAFYAFGATAQDDAAMRELTCKPLAEAVNKNIKNTENAKKATKSATWVDLGNAYLDLATQCSDDSLASEKAVSTYKKALEIENAAGGKKSKEIEASLKSEKLGNAFLMQGAAFYNNKNYKKASEYFGMSSDINQKDTTAALYAGIADQMTENNAGALTKLTRYIDNGGTDPSVYYSIAQIHKSQKDFTKAADIIKRGIKALPGNKDLPNELINVYLASGNLDQAITDLESMTKTDPNNTVNLTNLGLIYDSKAQELNQEISKLNNKLEDANTQKLDKKLLAEQDKLSAYESELASLNAKLKKDPKTAVATKKSITEVTTKIGEIKNDISGIIADIDSKKSKAGDLTSVKNSIAELSAKQSQVRTSALNSYNKVLSIDPNNYDVLYNVGVINFNEAIEIKKVVDDMDINTYRKEGKAVEEKACAQFAKAKPFFEKASKIKPEDDIVKEHLSNLVNILEQCNK